MYGTPAGRNGINYTSSWRFRTLDVIFKENRCVVAAPNNKKETIASKSVQLVVESRGEVFEILWQYSNFNGESSLVIFNTV